MSGSKFNKLHSARILILGGTSGVGFAVAEGSLESGATVIISSSSTTRISTAIDRLSKSYPSAASEKRILGYECDLFDTETLEENLRKLLDFSTDKGTIKLHHIVHTAGEIFTIPPLSELQADQVLKNQAVRYVSTLILAKLAPNYLSPGPNSSITFTTTSAAIGKPFPGRVTVIGQAGALVATAKALALELAPRRVNIVALGTVLTELTGRMFSGGVGKEEIIKKMAEAGLLGIIARPEDVVEVYLYYMRDRFVTGNVIVTDGGRSLA